MKNHTPEDASHSLGELMTLIYYYYSNYPQSMKLIPKKISGLL